MPDPSSEPEKYTLDQMMDRLKGRESDKQPELVVRPDGSQAMKVKKRRRRSNQAVNEETKRNKRIHVAQIAVFVILVVVLGLAAGIGILYANSSGFRDSLLGKLETSSGAEVALQQFRMNPLAANAGAVSFKWPAGNMLASMELKSPVAKISASSFAGGSFSGEEVVCAKGELILKAPSAAGKSRHVPRGDSDLPVRFSRYSIPALDVRFGVEAGSQNFLGGTEASLFPSTAAGQAEIRLRGGLLQLADWPPLALDRSYVKVRDSGFNIQSLRFKIPDAPSKRSVNKGYIDFSGTITPLEPDAVHTLTVEMEEFRLPYLIGADLGRFFIGRVDTMDIPDSNFLSIDPDSPEPPLLELTLTSSLDSPIDLAGFRFLSNLSVALDDRWYELPKFEDEISMVVRRRAGAVEIRDINLVNRGRMVIKGSVSNGEGGAITGKIRVGLPDTTLAAAPNKKLGLMFGQVREGYRWVDLEIGGTSKAPEDNFKDLYVKVAIPAEAEREEEAPQDSFENLIEGE